MAKTKTTRTAARTKLLLKFWAAMALAGYSKEQEWEAQERIWVADLRKLLERSKP